MSNRLPHFWSTFGAFEIFGAFAIFGAFVLLAREDISEYCIQ